MQRITNIAYLVFFVLCSGLSAADLFDLVKDGKPCAEIVLPSNNAAAKDILFFRDAAKKCTGADLPVVQKETGKRNRIVFQIEKKEIRSEDAFNISFPKKGTMKISGTALSIRWALNHIMEEYWGICPVFPGPHGTWYPKHKNLAVPASALSDDSGLKLSRDMYIEDPEWVKFLNGKKTAGNFFGHNIYFIFPLQKYSKGVWREKLMPMKKGKRQRPTDPYMGWQVCFSHPDAVSEAMKNICHYLKEHPDQKLFSLSVNDLEGYCECENCLKNNGGSFSRPSHFLPSRRNFSEVYYRWCNAVAAGVSKEFPDVYFGTLAYCGTIDPPSFRLHEKIVPILCKDFHQTMDPAILKDRKELFSAWNAKASNFGLWEYGYGCRAYILPRIYNRIVKQVLGMKQEYPALNAFFMEGSSFIGEGPKRYLYAKLLWKPEGDVDKWLNRWYNACAGAEAAPYLKAYYELWEQFWTGKEVRKTTWYKSRKNTYFAFHEQDYVFAFSPDFLKKASDLMNRVYEAAKCSGDDDQRIRAERLMLFHRYYEARIISCGLGMASPDGKFSNVEMAVRYVESLPRISQYTRIAEDCVKKIAAYKMSEPFHNSIIHVRSFLTDAVSNPNSEILLNELLLHIDNPAVAEAIRKTAEHPDLLPVYRRILKGLLGEIEKSPNLACPSGISPEQDRITWTLYKRVNGIRAENVPSSNGSFRYKLTSIGGWPAAIKCVSDLLPDRYWLYSLRITNPLSRSITATVIFANAARYNFSPQSGSSDRQITIPPGKTVKTAIFGKTRPGSYAARLYVIPRINKGESIYVDNIELKEIGWTKHKSPEVQIFPSDQPEKNWNWVPAGKTRITAEKKYLELKFGQRMISRQIFTFNPHTERLRYTFELQGTGSFFVDYYDQNGKVILQKRRLRVSIPREWSRFEHELEMLNVDPGVNKIQAAVSILIGKDSDLRIRRITCVK